MSKIYRVFIRSGEMAAASCKDWCWMLVCISALCSSFIGIHRGYKLDAFEACGVCVKYVEGKERLFRIMPNGEHKLVVWETEVKE